MDPPESSFRADAASCSSSCSWRFSVTPAFPAHALQSIRQILHRALTQRESGFAAAPRPASATPREERFAFPSSGLSRRAAYSCAKQNAFSKKAYLLRKKARRQHIPYIIIPEKHIFATIFPFFPHYNFLTFNSFPIVHCKISFLVLHGKLGRGMERNLTRVKKK